MTTQQLTTTLADALAAVYPPAEAQAVAALVAEHLLHLSPLQRRMAAGAGVPPAVAAQLPAMQARLLAHEPVQYVLGVAHFAGMELEVTADTLIPRPETEELAQLIVQANRQRPGLTVLDVGTGSGCLALALATTLPQPGRVLAVDISPGALAVAARNAARYAPLVEFQQLNVLRELPAVPPGTLDVLVSNPPYVLERERPAMRDNVLAWEPATALFVPDHDPLLFYRRLAGLAATLLRPGGQVWLEINEALGPETAALFGPEQFGQVPVLPDFFGRPRFVQATRAETM